MKHPFLALLPALAFLSPVLGGPSTPGDEELRSLVETITAEECRGHVEILASRDFQGRMTPSPGLEKAAEYVEQQLQALGLEPAGKDGSWRLPYTLSVLAPADGARCSWLEGEEEHLLEVQEDFVPLPYSAEAGVRGEPVFVGYAIDARTEKWQDLPERKVKDKVVFAFTREPRADDPKGRTFDGPDPTRYSNLNEKAKAVAEAGGVALVLVPDPLGFPDLEGPIPGVTPTYLGPRVRDVSQMSRRLGMPDIPVASVSLAVAEAIFQEDLKSYQESIDKRHKPKLLAAAKGVQVDLAVRWERQEMEVFNLAARIPGSDADGEVVVIGAHLDHVGINRQGLIHPGADDNASGSSALLEIAQAFAGRQPKEDILLLWFTGEEIGLQGSQAYCREPTYPAEKQIAMLNLDMVGRGEPKKANVGGLWDLPGWEKLVRQQARRIHSDLDLDLDQGRDLYGRSDQYSFFQAFKAAELEDRPALYFFEADLARNKVYHRPGDVPETIDGEKMARIARLCAATAYAVAFEGERP